MPQAVEKSLFLFLFTEWDFGGDFQPLDSRLEARARLPRRRAAHKPWYNIHFLRLILQFSKLVDSHEGENYKSAILSFRCKYFQK